MERTNSSSSEKYEPDLGERRPLTPTVTATTPRPGRIEGQERGKERTERVRYRNRERRATVESMSRTSALVDDSHAAPTKRPDPLARLASACKLTEWQKNAIAGNDEVMKALRTCLRDGELEIKKSGLFAKAPFALVICLTDEGFADIAATVLGLCRDPLARLAWVCNLTPAQMNAVAGNADVTAALKSCLQSGELEVKKSKFFATMPSFALILCLADEGFDDIAAAVIARCPKAAAIAFAADLLEHVCKDGWPISPAAVDKCLARAEKLVESMGKAVPQDSAKKLHEWAQAWKFRQPVRFADEPKKPDLKLSNDQPSQKAEEGKKAKKGEKQQKQGPLELPAGCEISLASYDMTIAYSGDPAAYPLDQLLEYIELQDMAHAQEMNFALLKSIFDNAANLEPPLIINDAQIDRAIAYLRELDTKIILHPKLSDEIKLWPKEFCKLYVKAQADWVVSKYPEHTKQALLILDKTNIQKGLTRSILVCQGKSKLEAAVLLEVAARHAQRDLVSDDSVPIQLAGLYIAAAFHQVHDLVDWQKFHDCFDWATLWAQGGWLKKNLGHLAALLVVQEKKWESGIKIDDLVAARGKNQNQIVSTERMESIAGGFVGMMCTLLGGVTQGKAIDLIFDLARAGEMPNEILGLLASRLAAGRESKFLQRLIVRLGELPKASRPVLVNRIGRHVGIDLDMCNRLIGANLHILNHGFYMTMLLIGALEQLSMIPSKETVRQMRERHRQFKGIYEILRTLMPVANMEFTRLRDLRDIIKTQARLYL